MPDGQVVSLYDMVLLAVMRWNITSGEINRLVFEEAKADVADSIEAADAIAANFRKAGVEPSIHFLLSGGNNDPYWEYITLIWRLAEIAHNRKNR